MPDLARPAAALRIDPATGLLQDVRQVISPHLDARPADAVADLIVVHGISLPPGEFGGPWIERLFAGSPLGDSHPYLASLGGVRVSAHALVRRDGGITQFVPFQARAWHAGASIWKGRSACNDFSIGIELEGTDELPYEDAQYVALGSLIRALREAYPALAGAEVVGHSDIAPGRKSDPGPAFDWNRLRKRMELH